MTNNIDDYIGYSRTGGSSIHYSTEEQEVGTWINNKKIYQRIIPINKEVTGTGQVNITENIPYIAIDELIYIDTFYKLKNSDTFSSTINRGYSVYSNGDGTGSPTIHICQEQTCGTVIFTNCIIQYTKK